MYILLIYRNIGLDMHTTVLLKNWIQSIRKTENEIVRS